jgi:hypothetical protein
VVAPSDGTARRPALGPLGGVSAGFASTVVAAWDDRPVNIRRVSWIVTVGVCLLIGLLLLVSGYQGYAAVALAVGAAAALNLT